MLAILDSLAHPRSSWEDPNLKFYYSLYDESFFFWKLLEQKVNLLINIGLQHP